MDDFVGFGGSHTPTQEAKIKTVDDTVNTVREFQDKVLHAQATGEEWIEVSDEVIKYYNKKGLNGSDYFIYGTPAVKVCAYGKKDEIINRLSVSLDTIKHGADAGFRIETPSK